MLPEVRGWTLLVAMDSRLGRQLVLKARYLRENFFNQRFHGRFQLESGHSFDAGGNSDSNRNQVVWLRNVDRLIELARPDRRSTWLDVGAGTGVAMCYTFLSHDFAKVAGIEINPELVAVAQRNFSRIVGLSEGGVFMHSGDAATHRLPAGNYTLFMFNPFGPETLSSFLALNASVLSESNSKRLLANDQHLLETALRFAVLLQKNSSLHLSVLGFGDHG